MNSSICFICAALIAIQIIFVPIYLKKMWPTKNWKSLGYKMICATSYLLLALTAVITDGSFDGYSCMMFIGFILSWFGDLMLHIPRPTKKFFVIGMIFFMAAHIFYCLGYIEIQKNMFSSLPVFAPWEFITAAVLVAIYFAVCGIKKVNFGEMLIPSIIYALFVTLMMVKSFSVAIQLISGSESHSVTTALLLLVGGISFVMSDGSLALISFDTKYKKFRLKVFNIVTYFIAQTCLALTIFIF